MDSHLGAQLKRAREASGLSLREIATRTKISVTALEAVERNDFSRLPGGIFGRSFVRAYALEVGLDPDAVVVSFVDALEQDAREAAARQAIRPEITADDRRFLARQQRAMLWLRIGVVLFILAAVVFVVWQLRGLGEDPPTGGTSLPASVDVPAVEPATFAPPPSDPIAEPAPATASEGDPAGAESRAVAAPPAADDVEAGADAAASDAVASAAVPDPAGPLDADGADPGPAPPATAGGAVEPMVFELTLSDDCWISYSVDGGDPVAQLFRAGDRRRIEAARDLVLDVGNAGALALRIDGRQAQPLGESGAHVRRRITREDVAAFLE